MLNLMQVLFASKFPPRQDCRPRDPTATYCTLSFYKSTLPFDFTSRELWVAALHDGVLLFASLSGFLTRRSP